MVCMGRALVFLAIALALQACVTSPPNRETPSVGPTGMAITSPPAAPVPANPSTTQRCREAFRVCVSLPSSWTISWNPLRDGTVGDIFLVGSWPFGRLPECRPIPVGQVLIALSETPPAIAGGYDPKPDRFEVTRLSPGGVREGCEQPMAELFRFLASGRALYAWMMFGPDFTTDARTDAEMVLSTLRVDPRS